MFGRLALVVALVVFTGAHAVKSAADEQTVLDKSVGMGCWVPCLGTCCVSAGCCESDAQCSVVGSCCGGTSCSAWDYCCNGVCSSAKCVDNDAEHVVTKVRH